MPGTAAVWQDAFRNRGSDRAVLWILVHVFCARPLAGPPEPCAGPPLSVDPPGQFGIEQLRCLTADGKLAVLRLRPDGKVPACCFAHR